MNKYCEGTMKSPLKHECEIVFKPHDTFTKVSFLISFFRDLRDFTSLFLSTADFLSVFFFFQRTFCIMGRLVHIYSKVNLKWGAVEKSSFKS